MRRSIALFILSLTLITLSGCGVKETIEPPKYTGAPTQLTIEVQRASAQQPKMITVANTESTTTDTIHMHLYKKDNMGNTIYQKRWVEEVAPDVKTVVFPMEIPAEQDYQVCGYIRRGDRLLGVGNLSKINAPIEKVTKVTVALDVPEYTLTKPDVMYSGGSLQQFEITGKFVGSESRAIFGFNPWTKNGWNGQKETNPSWAGIPEVTEPVKLYYQLDIILRYGIVPNKEVVPHYYVPDLDTATELPYIWVYPYPGYKP